MGKGNIYEKMASSPAFHEIYNGFYAIVKHYESSKVKEAMNKIDLPKISNKDYLDFFNLAYAEVIKENKKGAK